MQAKDLRSEAPRRWNVRIDGIPWLPRLIDKARAAQAGTLGDYLFGQSPVDRTCLHAFGVGHTEFARIVAVSESDEAVLATLLARDPGARARVDRWSRLLQARYAWFLFLLDMDDGYLGGPWQRVKPACNVVARGVTWTLKTLWPRKPWESSTHE